MTRTGLRDEGIDIIQAGSHVCGITCAENLRNLEEKHCDINNRTFQHNIQLHLVNFNLSQNNVTGGQNELKIITGGHCLDKPFIQSDKSVSDCSNGNDKCGSNVCDDEMVDNNGVRDCNDNDSGDLTTGNRAAKKHESCCQRLLSCRWILAYMCFLVRFATGGYRQSMSIAILSMVNRENVSTPNDSDHANVATMEREFDWSATFQGVVLTAFNGGSIMAPLLVGCLTRKTSERFIILVCLLVAGISSFLLPPLAKANDYTIVLTRGVMGLSLAGTDNVIQSLWSFWAPENERASLSSFAYAGISVSGIVTYPICGLLITLDGNNKGWPNIYYAFGIFTMLLVVFWWYNAFDSPKKHPRISSDELELISNNVVQHSKETNDELPWKSFLTSPAVWAIFVCTLANKLVFSLLLTLLPYYFHKYLNATLEESSLLSALPHIGRFVSGVLGGYLSDWMLRKGISIAATRKTFQSIGMAVLVASFGCATCAIALIFVDHTNGALAVVMLVMSMSFQNVASVAYRISVLDIAPRYAGFLGGLIGTITNILAVPAPVIASKYLLVSDSTSGWPMVFLTVAGINGVAGLLFLILAAGDVQHWAQTNYEQIP